MVCVYVCEVERPHGDEEWRAEVAHIGIGRRKRG